MSWWQAKIVLTSEVPLAEIFSGEDPVKLEKKTGEEGDHEYVDEGMRHLMDDLNISMDALLKSSIFVRSPWNYADLDWWGREVCFCEGVVKVSANGEWRVGWSGYGLSSTCITSNNKTIEPANETKKAYREKSEQNDLCNLDFLKWAMLV
jgi:hypothetical protein